MASNDKKDPFTPTPDNPEWTKEDFAKAQSAGEVFDSLGITPPRPVGRPRVDNPKKTVTLRLDPEVVEHFKQGGKGWQTRVNAALKEIVEKRRA